MGGLIERLLKKGLVARRKTEGDARTYQLAVTLEGRAASSRPNSSPIESPGSFFRRFLE